jgi:hypothetical protein
MLLLLSFADSQSPHRPKIEALPPIGNCHHEGLDSESILKAVLEGVQKANKKFGANCQVALIKYIQNDTGPETAYEYLAEKIVEYVTTAV